MLGHRELNMDDYLAILRRRMWIIVIPTVVLPLAAYLVSLKLPNRYTSQTLVLVEQQKVPDAFVKPVVTEDLNERLATMQEQILSRTRLQPIIERVGLFKDEAGKVPMEELVDRMRRSIAVTPIRPDADTRTRAMPGFYIAFTSDNPRLAQQVCSEITSMFVSENLRVRAQSAEGTTDFLRGQLEDAKRNLDQQDAKLADFKRKYFGQLPDQMQANLGMLGALKTQLDAVSQSLSRAQQDKTYAESMLQQQLADWRSSQSSTSSPQKMQAQLASLQSELLTLQGRYTDDHPDVMKVKKEIADLQKKLSDANVAQNKAPDAAAGKMAETEPLSIQELRLQIHRLDQAVRQGTVEQRRLQKDIGNYQARVQLSPMVEEQYKQLTRDYDTARKFYDDLLAKKTQSEMATDLERRQQGEQFRVMDPPNLPERPTWPNRPMIASGGLLGGLTLGFVLAFLLELRDKAIRSDSDIEMYLELPALALIPTVVNSNGNHKHPVRSTKEAARRATGNRDTAGAAHV